VFAPAGIGVDEARGFLTGRFAARSLPVPQVSEIGPAFGGHFAISTRAYGEPLECLGTREWDAVLPTDGVSGSPTHPSATLRSPRAWLGSPSLPTRVPMRAPSSTPYIESD
jgi:hypothetical protein